MRALFLLHYALIALVVTSSILRADPPQDFPAINLRGFGKLSGQLTNSSLDGQPTSVLKIVCENEDKAKLVHAKYLSDLQLVPGVHAYPIQGKEGEIPAFALETNVIIAAARDGANVYILSAASPNALEQLERSDFTPQRGTLVFKPEMEVPMYLDRWDKYAFRFYMGQWTTPPDNRNYDLNEEYNYAAQQDHIGMQFWADADKVNTAEGLTNEAYWKWGADAARAQSIPLGINTNAGFEAPVWLMNRFRDQQATKMPGYVGCFYDTGVYNLGAPGYVSWAGTTAEDALLGLVQQDVRSLTSYPNVTSFMEPHAETQHGAPDVMLEYGPVADASYREFLQQKYPTIQALNTEWKTEFKAWTDVRVPEITTFLGDGPQAVNLGGTWRIGYEPSSDGVTHSPADLPDRISDTSPFKPLPVPDDWFSESFKDDAWPEITAPGDDTQTLLPRWPAVFRRSFKVPPGWTNTNPKSWLYVWDLNRGDRDQEIKVALNGKVIGSSALFGGGVPHLAIFSVTDVLKDGANVLAIHTPQGRLNYKVYLSPEEPQKYPNMADGKNQQWFDFIDWDIWLRGQGIRRGLEMIRQVDANRDILMMSPSCYAGVNKDQARRYGGEFHDTGGMAGWWNDPLPALMRGIGMPNSVEPGNPAHSITDFQMFFGNWFTEGVNGVDYFMNIGDILWNPEIKVYFEQNEKLVRFMGKYHAPFAEVATLYSYRSNKLFDFPFTGDGFTPDPHPTDGGGFVSQYNSRGVYGNSYESDAVTESSFAAGDATKYRIITDSNTTVMDEATITAIEQYVKNGGIFVTYGDTGRHSPGKKDAWPIERLTGYHVADMGVNNIGLVPADPQPIFAADWATDPHGGGLNLEKVAPECTDLLLWASGGVAVGMRPLGKGYVINVGCRLNREQMAQLFGALFKWQKIATIPAHLEPAVKDSMFRHFITNNGLYDVWLIWNTNKTEPLETELVLDDTLDPKWGYNVKDGSKFTMENHRLKLKIAPFEFAIYLTPRANPIAGSAEWFTLQRGWWGGTEVPPVKELPNNVHKWSLDLSHDWAFKAVTDKDTVESLVAPNVDDSKWDKVSMGIWNFTPGHHDIRHAVLRKTFTVPAAWAKGEATFWLRSWDSDTFNDAAQIYIDGKPVFEKPTNRGAEGINPDGVLKAGTTHTIALDISGTRTLNGTRGTAWLWFWDDPVTSIDLAGAWDSSMDGLTFGTPVTLPAEYQAAVLRRKIVIPAEQKNRHVVIDLQTKGGIHNIIINGQLVARHHHNIGDHWHLDITPWVKFGGENTIQIAASGKDTGLGVQKVSLGFYDTGTYP